MVEDIVRREGHVALGTRLRRIGERLQGEVQTLIDRRGLPIQAHHYPLMLALLENGPLEIGQLARALGVSQPGVTRSVGQLAKLDCVRIDPDTRDRRIRRVTLTAQGRSVVQTGRDEIVPQLTAALDEILGADAPRLLTLLDRLENELDVASFATRADRRDKETRDG